MEEWIQLWNKIRPTRRIFEVGPWVRTAEYKLDDNNLEEGTHFLWEIVQNIPFSALNGWTFKIDNFEIKVDYCTQLDLLVSKLKPNDEDYRRRDMLQTIMEKSKRKITLQTLQKKKKEELKKMFDKLTLVEEKVEKEEEKEEDQQDSSYEIDSEDEEVKNEFKEKGQLISRFNELNKNYDPKRTLLNETLRTLRSTVKRMKREVDLFMEIESLKASQNPRTNLPAKIGKNETEESLKEKVKPLRVTNKKRITAGNTFNRYKFNQYFKEEIKDYDVEGIVQYREETVNDKIEEYKAKRDVIQDMNLTPSFSKTK